MTGKINKKMNIVFQSVCTFLASTLIFFLSGSLAQADKLQDILNKRELVVGVVNDAPPFGFIDKSGNLGSGLIDQSQKITVAAMQIADMKVCAHLS